MRMRSNLKKSQYKLPPPIFRCVRNYALSYPTWKAQESIWLGVKGMEYDGMPHGTSVGNPTESLGIKLAELGNNCNAIEEVARMAGEDLSHWLLLGVTEDITADELIRRGMPCCNKVYYRMRRKFFYLLAKYLKLY